MDDDGRERTDSRGLCGPNGPWKRLYERGYREGWQAHERVGEKAGGVEQNTPVGVEEKTTAEAAPKVRTVDPSLTGPGGLGIRVKHADGTGGTAIRKATVVEPEAAAMAAAVAARAPKQQRVRLLNGQKVKVMNKKGGEVRKWPPLGEQQWPKDDLARALRKLDKAELVEALIRLEDEEKARREQKAANTARTKQAEREERSREKKEERERQSKAVANEWVSGGLGGSRKSAPAADAGWGDAAKRADSPQVINGAGDKQSDTGKKTAHQPAQGASARPASQTDWQAEVPSGWYSAGSVKANSQKPASGAAWDDARGSREKPASGWGDGNAKPVSKAWSGRSKASVNQDWQEIGHGKATSNSGWQATNDAKPASRHGSQETKHGKAPSNQGWEVSKHTKQDSHQGLGNSNRAKAPSYHDWQENGHTKTPSHQGWQEGNLTQAPSHQGWQETNRTKAPPSQGWQETNHAEAPRRRGRKEDNHAKAPPRGLDGASKRPVFKDWQDLGSATLQAPPQASSRNDSQQGNREPAYSEVSRPNSMTSSKYERKMADISKWSAKTPPGAHPRYDRRVPSSLLRPPVDINSCLPRGYNQSNVQVGEGWITPHPFSVPSAGSKVRSEDEISFLGGRMNFEEFQALREKVEQNREPMTEQVQLAMRGGDGRVGVVGRNCGPTSPIRGTWGYESVPSSLLRGDGPDPYERPSPVESSVDSWQLGNYSVPSVITEYYPARIEDAPERWHLQQNNSSSKVTSERSQQSTARQGTSRCGEFQPLHPDVEISSSAAWEAAKQRKIYASRAGGGGWKYGIGRQHFGPDVSDDGSGGHGVTVEPARSTGRNFGSVEAFRQRHRMGRDSEGGSKQSGVTEIRPGSGEGGRGGWRYGVGGQHFGPGASDGGSHGHGVVQLPMPWDGESSGAIGARGKKW